MLVDPRIITSVIVIVVTVVFRLLLDFLFRKKLEKLVGHELLANTLTTIFIIAVVIYLLNVWGVIQVLLELLLAFSAITAVLLFAVKDIWISNLLAGISLIGDKHLGLGTEVEVAGKHGKIIEMTITITKMKTADGRLILVPNKKFREEVVVIDTKPEPQMTGVTDKG